MIMRRLFQKGHNLGRNAFNSADGNIGIRLKELSFATFTLCHSVMIFIIYRDTCMSTLVFTALSGIE